MSAGLFEDPDNPTEEEMMSNSAVAVAPVADQAEWIRSVAGEEEPESAAADGDESTEWLRYAALGLGVLALLAAGFWALRRR